MAQSAVQSGLAASQVDAEPLATRHFRMGLAFVCLGYLTIQLLYVQRTEFNPDEAQGAYAAWRLLDSLPYRDYLPYKTVLGYYWQSLMFQFADGTWQGYQLLRLQAVAVNTLCLALAGVLFARLYRRDAVLLALLVLVTMSNFLERSFEIRVDMLTAFAGLFSLYCLLSGKYLLAGLLCALSFFISQKAAYYIVASNMALLVLFLAERNRERFFNGVYFNAGCLIVTIAYFGTWFVLAPEGRTSKATFGTPQAIAFTEIYDYLHRYWAQTLQRNSTFYVIAVAHIAQLIYFAWRGPRPRTARQARDTTLAVYALVIAVFGAWHKQPWPYFFLILVPTAFVLHASFYHWLLAKMGGLRRVITALLVLLALIPLYRLDTILNRANYFQQEMVTVANRILGPDDSYVDGMDLLFDRKQAVTGLRWLDTRALGRLHAAGPAYHRQLIDGLERAPIKLIVRNWRLVRLPRSIQTYFAQNFLHFWGNIHVYAPTVAAGSQETRIKFEGRFEVVAPEGLEVEVDGRRLLAGDVLELAAGTVSTSAAEPFRLRLHAEDWLDGVDRRSYFEQPGFMLFRYPE